MSDLPPRRPFVQRLAMSLCCLLLLFLGTGCVSWDPIFRESMHLASLMHLL